MKFASSTVMQDPTDTDLYRALSDCEQLCTCARPYFPGAGFGSGESMSRLLPSGALGQLQLFCDGLHFCH